MKNVSYKINQILRSKVKDFDSFIDAVLYIKEGLYISLRIKRWRDRYEKHHTVVFYEKRKVLEISESQIGKEIIEAHLQKEWMNKLLTHARGQLKESNNEYIKKQNIKFTIEDNFEVKNV